MLCLSNLRSSSFLLRLCLGLALVGTTASQALAQSAAANSTQSWPQRPLRLLVGFVAGGPVDSIARIVASRLPHYLGQPVGVENRPGADASIAMEVVAKAAPDGYTYLFGQASTLAVNPYTFKSTGFDADRDFAAVISIGVSPFMIGVNPDLKVNTVAQLVALAKAQELMTRHNIDSALLRMERGESGGTGFTVNKGKVDLPKTLNPADIMILSLLQSHFNVKTILMPDGRGTPVDIIGAAADIDFAILDDMRRRIPSLTHDRPFSLVKAADADA